MFSNMDRAVCSSMGEGARSNHFATEHGLYSQQLKALALQFNGDRLFFR